MDTVPAKTIIGARAKKPSSWFGIDYNMNLYRGCCHGCIYCDSRSDCYRIEDFDRVRVKENCLEIVRNDLRRKVQPGVVGTGSMSDPYNPFEREHQYTRHALELLNAYGFGAAIATKSDLITRDIDVLSEIRAQMPVLLKITVTAADDALARLVEPHVCPSSARFAAIEKLSSAGLYTGVLLMPVLPFIEDNADNIRGIVRMAADAGARFIYPAFGMTTRQNQREHYLRALDVHFPGVREKHEKRYGTNYSCTSPRAKQLWELFCAECNARGLRYEMRSIIRDYRMGYRSTQLSLFEI